MFDEKDAKEEKNIDIKDLFEKKAFASNKKLTIDVKKIKRGVKILRFHYQISTEKNAIEEKIETERVLFID